MITKGTCSTMYAHMFVWVHVYVMSWNRFCHKHFKNAVIVLDAKQRYYVIDEEVFRLIRWLQRVHAVPCMHTCLYECMYM